MAENIENLPRPTAADDLAFLNDEALIPMALKQSTTFRKSAGITITQLKSLFSKADVGLGNVNNISDTDKQSAFLAAVRDGVDTAGNTLAKLYSLISETEPTITAGTLAQYWRGDKSWQTLATAVFGSTLSGLSAEAGTIADGDTLAQIINKLVGNLAAIDTLYAPKTLLHTYNRQTASYTAVLTDVTNAANNNVIVMITSSSANTFTIPPNSSVAFPLGCRIDYKQGGAGQTTMTAGAGVTLQAPHGLKVQAQYGAVSLVQDDTTADLWWVIGDLTT